MDRDVVLEIERVLKGGEKPEGTAVTPGYELGRLLRSVKKMVDSENGDEDLEATRDKGFTEELGVPDETKLACLGMSLAFLLFALMTGAAAHALQHQKEIINCVALMLIMELFFMAAMVCLFAINLAHGATGGKTPTPQPAHTSVFLLVVMSYPQHLPSIAPPPASALYAPLLLLGGGADPSADSHFLIDLIFPLRQGSQWIRSEPSLSANSAKLVGKRTSCSVATEPPPAATEQPEMDAPKEIFLKNYKKPDYLFDTVDLQFQLGEEKTIVTSRIVVSPGAEGISSPLVLHGSDLKLLSIKVNGNELKNEDYTVNSRHLTLSTPPAGVFNLEIVTEIYPQLNTSLEGLYKSTGNFCTQCEAEGFRKITYFQDRPDVMAKYTCRIEADKTLYPVLLSNGNLIEQGDLADGKHYTSWEDPFKKPCYLFALVAGQLECREDSFVTCSGRKVTLRIWTPAQDLPKTAHAMYSLKAAMKWDEEVFGLEYDLDLFNIVVVPDFNMGAMENKSLNVFQSRLVLASPETATDGDYAAILGVVGHEYFHNWTGNRVTCRDWFQLTLKEGLTVFRDQEFSSDLGCRPVKRIADVSKLRIYQFPQDAGPMAHPIRPHSYIKMDNFYTGEFLCI
ncbi:hypothetical protein PR202_ga21829 [Eleusine coracana subsp. coracana]|uniref:Peptidase M1 family protein n=1 Tax=Eleusine coracana subsp. coracana TaxID=191504 RepID=A0AAV5D1L0_ELECO|nr:hypothetical protein PR202_ga21829 [Eleusine coracana subsp. coracana]